MLDESAYATAKDNDKGTALHNAALNGHKAVVRLLLDRGPGAAPNDNNGWAVLHLAAGNGHDAVVKLLLDEGPDTTAKRTMGIQLCTLLH